MTQVISEEWIRDCFDIQTQGVAHLRVTHIPYSDRRVHCGVLLSILILKPLKTSSGQILARALVRGF